MDIEIPFLKSLLVEPKKAFAGQPAGLSILRSVVFVAIASMLMGMTRLADLQVNQPDVFSQLEIDFPYFMAACALAVTGIFFASAGISYGVAQGIDATGSFAQQTYFSSVYFAAFGEALAILGLLGGTKNPLAGLVVTALFWLVLCLGLYAMLAALKDMHEFGWLEAAVVLFVFVALPLFTVWLARPMITVLKVFAAIA